MKKLFLMLLLPALIQGSAFSQVTSYNFDPDRVNKTLAAQLDSLYQQDQMYRLEAGNLSRNGASKKTLDSIRNIISAKDSSNLVLATKLINQYGWLGPQEAGFKGTQALFLIIQHADLNTQKKYYPLILTAEKQGKILSSNVAIMEDRIAVREGRPQTYGSQGYYDGLLKKTITYPLADLQNLDQLRKSRGLPPMKEYLKDWNEDEYQKNLPYATQLLAKLAAGNKQ